jgi:DNA/RNA-binding domain of Phe-tRNA-synthetase-like protein
MNVNTIHQAYEKAVLAMLEAAPDMPRDLAEKAVEAIAELVIATINAELTKEEQDAIANH